MNTESNDASGSIDPLVEELRKLCRKDERTPDESKRYKNELDFKFFKNREAAEARELAELKENALKAIREGRDE